MTVNMEVNLLRAKLSLPFEAREQAMQVDKTRAATLETAELGKAMSLLRFDAHFHKLW